VKPIRCAVIGAGHLGKIHAGQIRKIENETGLLKLVAVVESDEARCNTLTQSLSVGGAASLDELEPTSYDAAIVASPTCTHHEVATKLIEQGKHCFIEKPFASNRQQCLELVELSESRAVTIQVGHVENFNPAWTAIRDELRNVKFIDAVRSGTYTGRSTDIGIVMDLMIHDLDLIAELVDSTVSHISAFGLSVLSQHEDFAEAHIRFHNGSMARVRASRLDEHLQRKMSVFAEGATAQLDFAEASVRISRYDDGASGRADELSYDERLRVKESLFSTWMPTEQLQMKATNAIEQELLDFARAIRFQASPKVDGHRGLRAVTMAEQVLAAIEHSAWERKTTSPVGSQPIHQFPMPSANRRAA
jgi:predicted dehydrogenase